MSLCCAGDPCRFDITSPLSYPICITSGKINMPYRSSEKTRQKKDAKRTAIMQAAVNVFAEKGYHAATVRDVVKAADVAIGT
ncbi:MAG: helix-turn-helix transcriptional regulator, partial [Anaerolineales bacterium]|nr:helix-turn-helix transcriptional regulator [Anaerolineales bacterium]